MDPVSRRAYFPNGVPETGHVWVQRDLAKLIRGLGEVGPGSFYTGDIAKRIARQVHANGGVLSDEDFRDFRAHNVRPLHIDYRGYDLFTPTLPAGGLTTLSILKTLEQFDLSKFEPWGARYIELFAGASNLCWKERFEYFGDPDFVNVPIADLLSEKRAIARAEMLRKGIATPVSRPSERPGTVNFVIIDKDRNMISWTATHGGGFGSHVAIEGLGLMLGHGMSRFAFTAPDPNYPAPGKRPQHNMSPLLVLHGGKPYAALGMPGGRAIVTFTAQMVVNLIDFKAAPQRIVSSPRIHTEGQDPIELSQVPKPVVEELRKMGHKVEQVRYLGGEANAAIIDPKTGDVEAVASGEPPGVLVF
jgi:gamma-glutamyltranspeptidase/glutathione hydrolase